MSYGGTSVVADYGGVALRRKCQCTEYFKDNDTKNIIKVNNRKKYLKEAKKE